MQLRELMLKVVEHIDGWEWQGREEDQYWHLVHEDGATVGVWTSRGTSNPVEDQRLELYPRWPTHGSDVWRPDDPGWRTRRISVAGSRSPESIAKDIERRLLDGLPEVYAECVQNRDEFLAEKAMLARRAEVWAEKLGATVSKQEPHTFRIYRDGCCLDVECCRNGGINIKRHGWLSKRAGDAVLNALVLTFTLEETSCT